MRTAREQPIRIIKRGRKHKAHHGGAWKVAFADFMTSMMALFLVLWLITQSSDVRAAIAGYFQDPLGRSKEFGNSVIKANGQPISPSRPSVSASPSSGKDSKLLELSQQLHTAVAGMGGDKHVVIEITPDGLRISLLEDSSDVFFATGSAHPLPHADSLFRAIGGVLGRSEMNIEIEGHTDAHPYISRADYSNWELSADRANVTRKLLTSGGLGEKQVRGVRGFADRQPRVANDPFAPQNRRVTILANMPSDAPQPAAEQPAAKPAGSSQQPAAKPGLP